MSEVFTLYKQGCLKNKKGGERNYVLSPKVGKGPSVLEYDIKPALLECS